MSHETQATVAAWMNATFPGADPESPRKSLRTLEECVELCVASGAGLSEIMSVVDHALSQVPLGGFHRREPAKIPSEAADVLIVLYGVAHMRGFDLHAEVDKKMSINRARKWAPRGDGTGYHVREHQE